MIPAACAKLSNAPAVSDRRKSFPVPKGAGANEPHACCDWTQSWLGDFNKSIRELISRLCNGIAASETDFAVALKHLQRQTGLHGKSQWLTSQLVAARSYWVMSNHDQPLAGAALFHL